MERYNLKPFKSDIYNNLFEADSNEGDHNEKVDSKPLTINYNEIYRRLEKIGENGYSLYSYKTKNKDWLLYLFNGQIKCLEISNPEAKPKVIKDLPEWGYFTCSNNDIYFISRDIYKLDLTYMKADKIVIEKDVEKNLNDEFRQILYEGWAIMDQNFYDVNFHSIDWKSKINYYASFLPFVRERAHLRTLFNDMLGELNSSHMRFTSKGKEEVLPQVKTISTETGIIWQNENPFTIDRILTDSPANCVDIDIKPEDKLVAVNGIRISEKQNREFYFATSTPTDEIKLTFNRRGKEFSVKFHTISYENVKVMLYTEWEDNCRKKVNEQINNRVGYIHMRDMESGSLMSFLLAMYTDIVHKDALILDLRYNNGGNVHNDVLDFLRQKSHFRWSYRDFKTNSNPNVTPGDKPIVVLVNERSLSDAEVTSNGIKTLGIAKIIGTETYRWIIFTSSVSFIDGSTCRMPAWGCYSLDGKDLESTGVKPDIYVKNIFTDRLYGKDPQLDTAIREIIKQLK